MDILQSQALQAELRERTEQFGQCWANFQQQFVEMQQSYHHTIQRLSLQLHEMRLLANDQEDNLQAAQEGSPDLSYVQNKRDNLAGNGSALADGNQSMTNNGSPDDFMKGKNAHAVPVFPSSLLGIGGFFPPGQMAGMHSYMLHPQGITQSLAPPNSGVPQFGTFQPTIQVVSNQAYTGQINRKHTMCHQHQMQQFISHPNQDQNVLQSGASKNSELSSKQSQVAHPEYPTAHAEQQQRSPSIIAEQTHEPKSKRPRIHLRMPALLESLIIKKRAELKGEKVTSGKQSVEQVPRKQNQASDLTGSTTQEPALLDERSLLACIVRAVPAGSDN